MFLLIFLQQNLYQILLYKYVFPGTALLVVYPMPQVPIMPIINHFLGGYSAHVAVGSSSGAVGTDKNVLNACQAKYSVTVHASPVLSVGSCYVSPAKLYLPPIPHLQQAIIRLIHC